MAHTFLFTDIEGSTRLWETQPEAMRLSLAWHDERLRRCVAAHRGRIVKTTGDGIHAVFDDALDAVQALAAVQQAMDEPTPAGALPLRIRAGAHCGESEARDGDFYGPVLNRAARLMGAAHGGQSLVSQGVADAVAGRLPGPLALQDLGLVRLRDLSSPERVHQVMHPALRAQFPPLRSLEATPNNLAQQLNSFVGREAEMADTRTLLRLHRLVTLVGMGGIGKSRLSVQLGAELMDDHPDGVWLVELAPVTDGARVPQALASVLGVKEEAGQAVTESLLAWVRDKRLLVILDNCEHVLHAAAALAKQLLQAAAGVKVLASSRDALQVAGEVTYPVPTLGVPAGDEVDAATLSRHEAVRLFIDRATAAQAHFRLSDDNAAAVAEICRRLDGIPLALELAAARTRALAPQAIAARLHDRFRLLSTQDQTVLPRQRTLRALIDWSFDLLSPPERALFRRLAVFAGGFTLEAAEAVGSDDADGPLDVIDLLAQLVGKSLVVMEPGGARYRMLETVRAYAQEKLEQAGDEADARRRHLGFYLALAEAARSRLLGSDQAATLLLLDAERENLLAAHAWCDRDAGCRDQGLQLVFVLKTYWHMRGLLSLSYRLAVQALARTHPEQRDFGRCRALCDAGQLCVFMGRHQEALGYLEESLAIAEELGDATRKAAALQPLGMVQVALGQRERARASYEASVRLAGQTGNRRLLMAATNALAQLSRADGDLVTAEALYARTLELAREQGDAESSAITLLNRSMVAIMRGQHLQARPWLAEVLGQASALGSRPVEQSLLDVAAGLSAAHGEWQRCAALFGASEAQGRASGIRRDVEDQAFLQPWIDRARSALGDGGFAQAEQEGAGWTTERRATAVAAAINAP